MKKLIIILVFIFAGNISIANTIEEFEVTQTTQMLNVEVSCWEVAELAATIVEESGLDGDDIFDIVLTTCCSESPDCFNL